MFAPLARRLRPHSALPVHFSVSLTFRRAAHRRTLCTSLNPVQPPVSERIKTVYPRFERKAMETLNIENEFNFR